MQLPFDCAVRLSHLFEALYTHEDKSVWERAYQQRGAGDALMRPQMMVCYVPKLHPAMDCVCNCLLAVLCIYPVCLKLYICMKTRVYGSMQMNCLVQIMHG